MTILTNANAINPTFPVEVTVRYICAQHRNLARVLTALATHAGAIVTGKCAPDFVLIAAILHYIDTFSDRIHHSMEGKYLFPAMQQNGAPDRVIDSAIGAQREAAKKFAALQGEFKVWRNQPGAPNPRFLEILPDYISSETENMSYEENVVLPCAVDSLPAKDWTRIANACSAYDDPLFGINPAAELAPLHHLVLA